MAKPSNQVNAGRLGQQVNAGWSCEQVSTAEPNMLENEEGRQANSSKLDKLTGPDDDS